MSFECIEITKGADHELTRDLAAVAKKHGIEFVVCITQGQCEKFPSGAELRVLFIDAKDEETDTVHAATAMLAGGMYLCEGAKAMAEFEGKRRRAESDRLGGGA